MLKGNSGKLYEGIYIIYLLYFKLWKRLVKKHQYVKINKEDLAKLKPPAKFAERLKRGMFPNVLPFPYMSMKENLTNFVHVFCQREGPVIPERWTQAAANRIF